MTFQAVSFVDGLRYQADDVRHLSYLASLGQTGVATADSLRVAATPTPSGNVIVYAGVATVVGAGLVESYIVTNDQAVTLAIPPNNTPSLVYRNVIFSIRDPQKAGMPALSGPTDIAGDLQVVGALPTDRPFIWLAHIPLPAHTGTVTQAMIANRRQMPQNRSVTRTYIHFPTSTRPIPASYTQVGGAGPTFFCPPGMTHANVLVSVEGLEQTIAGYHRLMVTPTLNGVRSSLSQEVAVTRNGPVQRHGFTAMGSFKLEPGWAGTEITAGLRGHIAAGTADAFEVDTESTMCFQVEFYEDVD